MIPLNNKEKNAIRDWFIKGRIKGYICGPFDDNYKFPWPLHISPLFVVPKPLKDEYRPICHLSHKQNENQYSVNDILSEDEKHVQYVQFKEIVEMMLNAGKNAYMWTIDAQDAYYRVPIHRDDYKYMGLKWENQKWIFLSLQMGLASAPKIYTRFGDAVEYIIINNNKKDAYINGKQSIRHYLDDYFGVGVTKAQADILFNATIQWFNKLNIPTQPRKCSPSNRKQLLLGWRWNSCKLWCELTKKKQKKALARLRAFLRDKKCTKKQMERLVGILQHISLIIFPGKTFVRRFEILIHKSFINDHDIIEIDDWIMEDVHWWIWVLEKQTHVRAKYTYLLKKPSAVTKHIWTDAASTIGIGGILDDKVYQIKWENTKLNELIAARGTFDIHAQEMLGALVAVKLWAPTLTGECVALYNDNPGAAGAIITKAPPLHRLDMQYMIRELAKLSVKYKFYFWGIKVDGANNEKADALSRFKDLEFFNVDDSKCDMVNFTDTQYIVNEYMDGLIQYRKNVDPKIKKWDMYALTEINIRRNRRMGREIDDCSFAIVQNESDYIL